MIKYLLISLLFIAGCKAAPNLNKVEVTPLPITDTVYVAEIEKVFIPCNNDSLQTVIDTLSRRLLHAKLVISNVKYYVDICVRNPSQDKFLKGWVKRAVE